MLTGTFNLSVVLRSPILAAMMFVLMVRLTLTMSETLELSSRAAMNRESSWKIVSAMLF